MSRFLFPACLAAMTLSVAARAGETVYSNDFEKEVGKEWSQPRTEETPRADRRFLGPGTTEKISLKLEKLPPHKYVRISLELLIMATWDGNGTTTARGSRIGPDYFRMNVEGGPMLVDASFSNLDFDGTTITKEAQTQSYPSVLPGESHPARTGAAENNSLGFEWTFSGGGSRAVDSLYKLSFVVPHSGETIQFNFQGGEGLQPADDECWGLDNLKVEALAERDVPRLEEAEMRRLWEAIGGRDIVAETAAFWKLAAGGDDVARFMRTRVKQAGVDRRQFDRLLTQVDANDFKTREKATEELRGMGPSIEPLLREAIERSESAEVRMRLETALRNMDKSAPADPEARRFAIAMKLLGVIGTAEAEKVAREISGK